LPGSRELIFFLSTKLRAHPLLGLKVIHDFGGDLKIMTLKSSAVSLFIALGFVVNCTSIAAPFEPLGINPNFTHLMTDSKETVGEVLTITQDKKGFIWVGGRSGLARNDGYRFHIYQHDSSDPTSIGSSYIHDIVEDSYGELWIATDGGGVAKLNRELDNFRNYKYAQEGSGVPLSGDFERVYEDAQKNLWIVGSDGIGLYDRKNDQFIRYLHNTETASELLLDMVQIDQNEYLFAAENGLRLWNRRTNKVEKIFPNEHIAKSLPNRLVKALLKDSRGNIWIGHAKGLARFIPSSKTFESVVIENSVKGVSGVSVWKIFEDKNKILWLSTDGNGLMWFNPATGELGAYSKTASGSSLKGPVVRFAYEDRAGDFWVGMFPIGLDHYDSSNSYFSVYTNFVRDDAGVFKNQVWAFSEDKKNNLWLGVDSIGLVYFDRKKNTFSQNYEGFDFSNLGFPHSVLSLFEDSRGNLWCGSWAQGVSRFNLKTKAYKHYNPSVKEGSKFQGTSVWHIMEDHNGDILFGSMNEGVIRYNYKSDSFKIIHSKDTPDPLSNNNIWALHESKDGHLWIGTSFGINVYDRKSEEMSYYRNDVANPKSLSQNAVNSFFEDSKGRLWIGTLGGGLNLWHPEDKTFTHVRAADGLNTDAIAGVVEDESGILWVSNRGGITAFDPNKNTFQQYTGANWLQDGEFSHGSYLKLRSGELAFGGVNGFNIFNPKDVTSNNYVPPIFFTELEVLSQKVRAGLKDSPLQKDIVETEKITLNYTQPVFSIEFAAINYRVYENNQYRYKLEGFDRDWHTTSPNNRATYTHLDPGSYTFSVMASNNNNLWSGEKKSVEIIVLPAPWATWWAYCIYTAIVFSLIAWYVIAQRNKILHEKKINTRLVELDKLKDDFLANMSHELRTPINGIIGVSEALLDGLAGPQSKTTLNNLGVIVSCGRRLERLVNDILDFSKSKKTGFVLEYRCVDVFRLLEEVVAECRPNIVNDAVKITNSVTNSLALIYADAFRTKHIFYNLIANAIKFTEFGSITIAAEETDDEVKISIKDTGIGIGPEQLSQLYTSFTQLTESGARTKSGTGLGLAMTKYFVDAQGGQLVVESTLGIGSTFTVSFPKATAQQIAEAPELRVEIPAEAATIAADDRAKAAQARDASVNLAAYDEDKNSLPVFYPKGYDADSKTPRIQILVVDDELVNRMVLRHMLLKHEFIVYEAANGKEVIDAMHKGFKCDLILLDIMMPKMSGIEACREIRTRYSPSELPIIFVSAKTQVSDVVECFNIEGNDFLSKPVNREELYARLESHLRLLVSYRKLEKSVWSQKNINTAEK
jgi:two-component system, sensor histidine kinase ChiS